MFEKLMPTVVACAVAAVVVGARAATDASTSPAPRPAASQARPAAHPPKPALDRSGRTRVGKASFYAGKFDGRKMADGTRMDPQGDNAASKTLPLGTTAKVTNLQTGESAVVTIRDRGPHVPGRIVDLSPQTAQQVGLDRHEGVSKVAVTPLALPPRDAGAGSRETPAADHATAQEASRATNSKHQ